MFRKFTKLAIVSRQGYSTESGYKKSGYAPTGKSYKGHLKALSLSAVVESSAFGRDFQFHTEPNADIKESDQLTIDGSVYGVKGVAKFSGVTFSSLQCILTKAENLG